MLDQSAIENAASALKQGQLSVFPTDTAYGLGCLYDNQEGIARILSLKQRTNRKFTAIAASIEQVNQFFPLNKTQRNLAEKHWPGPLSIVVSDRLSIRVPNNEIAKQLAKACGKPIIATSANRSGDSPAYTITAAKAALGQQQVAAWLDGGPLPERQPSTVVRVEDNGTLTVLREGPINLHE